MKIIKIALAMFLSLMFFRIVMSFLTGGQSVIWRRPYLSTLANDTLPLMIVSGLVSYMYSLVEYKGVSMSEEIL